MHRNEKRKEKDIELRKQVDKHMEFLKERKVSRHRFKNYSPKWYHVGAEKRYCDPFKVNRQKLVTQMADCIKMKRH